PGKSTACVSIADYAIGKCLKTSDYTRIFGAEIGGAGGSVSFSLIYSECCGGPAVLRTSLLGPASAPAAVPEPGRHRAVGDRSTRWNWCYSPQISQGSLEDRLHSLNCDDPPRPSPRRGSSCFLAAYIPTL